jgi:sugar/nucleoside kinase (ribokinase family)
MLVAAERADRDENGRSVFETIEDSTFLIVNAKELGMLLRGRRQEPAVQGKRKASADEWKRFLGQGLDLGPQNLVVTAGPLGSFGAVQDGEMDHVGVTRSNRRRGFNGLGDALHAGVIAVDGEMEERLRRGSATSSFALDAVGAHENIPTVAEVNRRMDTRPPRIQHLSGKGSRNRTHIPL